MALYALLKEMIEDFSTDVMKSVEFIGLSKVLSVSITYKDSISGSLIIEFQDKFKALVKTSDPESIILLDKKVMIVYKKIQNKFECELSGVSVDVPGPFNPKVHKVLIEDTKVTISGDLFTKEIPIV